MVLCKVVVSIHAPTRGATPDHDKLPDHIKFQSTHPHGVRQARKVTIQQAIRFQSTHPHGVRHRKAIKAHGARWFQSTHPHGVRLSLPAITIRKCGFNPRTHTGCDERYLQHTARQLGFNPRTHTGCDMIAATHSLTITVSIHAPTRGATLMEELNPAFAEFQSTHPHGVRPWPPC